MALTGVSKSRNPLIDIMNAVTILKGNPDKIQDICKKLFAPEPDKNGMLYIQNKNNLNQKPNYFRLYSRTLDTPGYIP